MSGTPHFKINCFQSSAVSATYSQEWFKLTWDFFKYLESVGYCTEIARNNGKAATYTPKPLGTDFHDGTSPFGMNAWATFRMDSHAGRTWPYYIHFSWSTGANTFDDAPNTGALFCGISGATLVPYVGFQLVAAYDGGGAPANPWPLAATGNMGADAIQSVRWAAPEGGKLLVFPVSNADGNAHSSSVNNYSGYRGIAGWGGRLCFIADRDNVSIFALDASDSYVENLLAFGMFSPYLVFQNTYPIFSILGTTEVLTSSEYGDLAGTSITRQGGITLPDGQINRSLPVTCVYDSNIASDTPNTYVTGGPSYLLYPLSLKVSGGMLGEADKSFFRVAGPAGTLRCGDTSLAGDWIILGNSGSVSFQLAVPWDNTTPNTGFIRDGVSS